MRAKRVDSNHSEIAQAFRVLGFEVEDTSRLGNGFPDLLVGKPLEVGGRFLLVEVKDGSKPLSRRQLTEAEERFHERWKSAVAIVESVDDVLRIARNW